MTGFLGRLASSRTWGIAPAAPRVGEGLVKAEVLEDRDGAWRFQVPLLALWVRGRLASGEERGG